MSYTFAQFQENSNSWSVLSKHLMEAGDFSKGVFLKIGLRYAVCIRTNSLREMFTTTNYSLSGGHHVSCTTSSK